MANKKLKATDVVELQAYKRLVKAFKKKGYLRGNEDNLEIYTWTEDACKSGNLTPGHYVDANNHGKIEFDEVPDQYRTMSFFLHALSDPSKDIIEYVKNNFNKFDKQFFKDHMATNRYALQFELNDFAYMPINYIDEEMVFCAMLETIKNRYIDRRGDCKDWFFSVWQRKPELLTKDMYILGARCFAEKINGKNEFLEITPKEYLTEEYYMALCLGNRTPVMEDIPEEILTDNFLSYLLADCAQNIQCFSEKELEKSVAMGEKGKMKFWQIAIYIDGYQIENIPLNEERIKYFMSLYDKDSCEYDSAFRRKYNEYLREKNNDAGNKNRTNELASVMTLVGAASGQERASAIELGTDTMNKSIDRQVILPIEYAHRVPKEYAKMYDKDQYLCKVYEKFGIQVLRQEDSFYYRVSMPDDISTVQDASGYCVKNSDGKSLIHYIDNGKFYDRIVRVDQISNVIL